MNSLHLVSNAHLDPVWMWEWEEGAAEAISTFRTAADLCEEFDGFVFNHNEAVLYQWIEEYEPELFERIRRLVSDGRWHIMGGWFLQPDCNMPSGESFVRQIIEGRRYFQEKFGVRPTTAINFDPFGHNRGLVQILTKSGYDSYLFCRPQKDVPLPAEDFTWVGFDGSTVTGHRVLSFYNSGLGKAREKVEKWIEDNPDKRVGMVLWGVGNHGGGPSRQDLRALAELQQSANGRRIAHSTPEAYFEEIRSSGTELPRYEGEINPWGPGCYTSQIRIKQKHRLLENMLYSVEKMACHAALEGRVAYPREGLAEARKDLLFSEFHDILPGSSIPPVEEAGLRLMDHGLEILSRIRARTFFALASGQPKAAEGRIPILVYNPHPFPVRAAVECEFQLADANWGDDFTLPVVYQGERRLPCQNEKEWGNINLDWRKHVVFHAELAPSQMSRFDCRLERVPERPKPGRPAENGRFTVANDRMEASVSAATGLLERYAVDGFDYVKPGAFKLLVVQDNEDPWETRYLSFRDVIGAFELMTAEEATRFAALTTETLEPVHIVEDGEVRTVIEAFFRYGDSFAVVQYKLPKQGAELEIDLRIHWAEKSKMLKLSIPTAFSDAAYCGQVAFGVQYFPTTGREVVAQKWTAAVSESADRAFTCINNGTHGSDCADGEIRLSLLRGAAYSAHPIGERPLVLQDRYIPRIDQGERTFRFWFQGGPKNERLERVDREALAHNEAPYALSFSPSGQGTPPRPGLTLDDEVVQLTTFKAAEDGRGYIVRLFEPTGQGRGTMLRVPSLGIEHPVRLAPFEVKTLRLHEGVRETNLLEA